MMRPRLLRVKSRQVVCLASCGQGHGIVRIYLSTPKPASSLLKQRNKKIEPRSDDATHTLSRLIELTSKEGANVATSANSNTLRADYGDFPALSGDASNE